MKVLIIDNYDSFTYNLYQYIGELGGNPVVVRNDQITVDQIKAGNYSHIIISPGPGDPTDRSYFGICTDVIATLGKTIPILGVCLGHQGIISGFGGNIIRAPKPMHGKQSTIHHNSHGIFTSVENPLIGMRYHSLMGKRETLPSCLTIDATSSDGVIMAVSHRKFPIFGIQFHPESIGTQEGKKILKNFLNINIPHQPVGGLSGSLPRRQAGLPRVSPVFNYLFQKLKNKQDLTKKEAGNMLELLLSTDDVDDQKKDLLRLLSEKGETIDEIAGFIKGMRERMVTIDFNGSALDTCGTGGDGKGTFNISTISALVVAGCGIMVAKHGNRSATSKCGSADVLETLGVNCMMNRETAEKCLKDIGITFLFAPLYHSAMKILGPIRKSLGQPTIFNMLGPFLNPVGVKRQLIGVATIAKAETLIKVGSMLDYERLLIVSSEDGLDEISCSAPTHLFEYHNGKVKQSVIDPKKYGLHHSLSEIIGGNPQENAEIFKNVLLGKQSAYQDVVILNSAVALIASGLVSSIEEGIEKARESIVNGLAKKKLEELKKISNSV